MYPSYSVIFFSTASGAGYGLLAVLGLTAALGLLPPDVWLGLVGMGLALALVSAGLLASTGHLGRPERAWRAFSQWRTSWLSREGVLAVATYVPAAAFAIGWVFFGRTVGWVAVAGALSAIGAALTVSATAMIYASLKPVGEWRSPFTLPAYLVFAALTGAVLFNAILLCFGRGSLVLAVAAILLTALGWACKEAAWRRNDAAAMPATVNSATGLAGGVVRSIEWPHTERNYLLKEMGFRIARKHARRLRAIARLLAFLLPIVLLLVALTAAPVVAAFVSALAAIVQLAGMLVERWLFFAEARHTVTLYYGYAAAA